jgi:hypothetical protein
LTRAEGFSKVSVRKQYLGKENVMPNHVYNSVTIEGSPEQVKDVQKFLATPTFMNESGEELIFNFAKLISIPKDKVGEYHTVHGFVKGEESGHTEYNWYEWNVKNWGTKWNAYEVSSEIDGGSISYHFNTAWSIPEPIIHALADYARQGGITFDWHAEEEQGWGAEFAFDGKELTLVREWDIPETHAEYVALEQDCWGCESDEPFDDCPKEGE